jgi:acetyl-CoA carboxylase biotin carboxylase subunit
VLNTQFHSRREKKKAMFRKILIANRSEIALRIIRACKDLDVETAAVYSEVDRESLHVKLAHEAHYIGSSKSNQSYLNIHKIIKTAKKANADAIHPGYGFLAQTPAFAKACEENHLKFIGPSSAVLEKMGNKVLARKAMAKAGLVVVPGSTDAVRDAGEAAEAAEKLGFPIVLKAIYGGGGRGMRIVASEQEMAKAFELAQLEAETAFGSGEIYVEKRLTNPRHVEFQILADEKGNVTHLGERECSIQRKHQKLMEESPSPMMTDGLRKTMGNMAVQAAETVDYTNAGTIEFLVDEKADFHFLEMNTRLQVEHLVTELVTGIDIVKEQIRIADGAPLQCKQEEIILNGHAIDCRINAEDPNKDFTPCPGTVTAYRAPGGPGVRVDSALYSGYTVPVVYDSLVSKLAVWGRTREEAIRRMRNALDEYRIEGFETTIPLHKRILEDEQFIEGRINTGFIHNRIWDTVLERALGNEDVAAMVVALTLSKHKRKSDLAVIPQRKPAAGSRWRTFGRVSLEAQDFKWST